MIPEEIRAFLRECIKSVWALDLLLLLKSAPARAWTANEVNDRLRSSVSLVEEILETLKRRELVTEEDKKFRYAASPNADRIISQLAQIYGERPMAVIKEILSAPNEKIHSFVDAFRLKKD